MQKASWDAKHRPWHNVLTILMRAVWTGILIIWGMAFLGGAVYFWFYISTPLNLICGVPLLMIGLALVLLGPADFLQYLFSAKVRRGTCLFCQPVLLRDFFVPNSINNHLNRPKAHPPLAEKKKGK